MSITKLTKAEIVALLKKSQDEVQALRHRMSVLEGEKALRTQPASTYKAKTVVIRGEWFARVTERHGQRVVTRYVPVTATN